MSCNFLDIKDSGNISRKWPGQLETLRVYGQCLSIKNTPLIYPELESRKFRKGQMSAIVRITIET